MFIHNFKYSLKTLFRNRSLIFWTYAFPIILGTLFNMAFSNIENSEKLNVINIAIVDNESFKNNEVLKTAFKELSNEENEDRLFNIKYVEEEEAKELLDNDDISGYLKMDEEKSNIIIKQNGINETVFKQATEEIIQTSTILNDLAEEKIKNEMMQGHVNIDYEKIYKDIQGNITNEEAKISNISNSNLSYTMIEFYTLIAMTCLYGATIGMNAINNNLPNMSSKGKRIGVSPVSKLKAVISSTLASFVVSLIGLAILFLYTVFVLKVDYGNNMPLIILLGVVGSLSGISMGLAVGTLLKVNENSKMGILIALTMFGCYLSGMMGITMKYIIDKNIPIINKLNPASMITDGLYSLYYYDTLDRYFVNIASLLIFSGILVLISYTSLRRQRYDSI